MGKMSQKTAVFEKAETFLGQGLLTVRSLSLWIGLSESTVYRLVEGDEIPFIQLPGGGIRFKQKDIDEWLEKRAKKPTQNSLKYHKYQQFTLTLPPGFDSIKSGGVGEMAKANSKSRLNFGFGAIYKRQTDQGNNRWYLDYRDAKGKRVQKVIPHAQTSEEALIALKTEVAKAFNGEYKAACRKEDISFEEFSRIYLKGYMSVERKNWRSDGYRLQKLTEFFKDAKLREVTPEKVRGLKKARMEEGNSERTVNRYLALLKRMFNVAIEDAYAKENPVRQVKFFSEKDTLRERILSQDEEKRLLAECADHLKPVVLTAIHSGMRVGEILSLKWKHVNLAKKEILVEKTKGKTARLIPINQVLFGVLLGLKHVDGRNELVFPLKSIRTAFENACRRAGLEDFTFHDLRRTFGTRLLEKGADIVTIQRLYGHSSALVTQRYLHPCDELKKEAVELLAEDLKEEKKPQICDAPVTRKNPEATEIPQII